MAAEIKHATVATGREAGRGDIRKAQWNETHTITGTIPVANGGTDAADAPTARTNLGVGTGDSPQFAGVNVGNASDTTLTRSAAGVLAVEGGVIPKENRANTFTADQTLNNSNLYLNSNTAYAPNVIAASADTTAGASSLYTFRKARGTYSVPTAVSNTDQLGGVWFYGHDGSNYIKSAAINAIVNGTPGTNDMPGALTFNTTADGTNFTLERMRISQDGDVLISSNSLSVGNADTTITRSAAGVIAVEGGVIPKENRANAFTTTQTITGPAGGTSLILTDATNSTLNVKHESPGNLLSYDTNGVASQRWVLNGSERMRIDSSGNVGIGGTPGVKLDVAGTVRSSGTNASVVALATTGVAELYAVSNARTWRWAVANSDTGALKLLDDTAGVERMRIDFGGNVGIGATPTVKLEVGGTNSTTFFKNSGATTGYVFADIVNTGCTFRYGAATSGGSFWSTGSAGSYSGNIGTASGTALGFGTSDTLRMQIDPSGLVGIGGTPSARLHVNAGATDEVARLESTGQPFLSWYDSGVRDFYIQNATGTITLVGETNKNVTIWANSAERLRITTTGDVLNVSSGGLGYGTGSGGTVTQTTSRATGVTINKTNGSITLFTEAGSASLTYIVVTNSTVAATDTIVLAIRNSTNTYSASVSSIADGIFAICFYSLSGTASDTPIINFSVIKAVNS